MSRWAFIPWTGHIPAMDYKDLCHTSFEFVAYQTAVMLLWYTIAQVKWTTASKVQLY